MKPTTVSIRTVAEVAGVSIATVSNVLNKRTNVGADLVRRVRLAVDELGYVADGAASRLRSRRQALVGVIVPDLRNPMFSFFVSTLEMLARQDAFDLIVASCRNDAAEEAERLNAIRAWRPAGCIVIPVDGALGERRPRGTDLPIVAADRIPDDPAFDLVAVDNAGAAMQVTEHLRAAGYVHCLVVGVGLAITNVRERWEGASVGAADELHLELLQVGLDPEGVRVALHERLAHEPLPDVVFSLDHGTTLIAFQVLGACGLVVPSQVALASFDDLEWMRLVSPGITAIGQPVESMARAAWGRLMSRVAGDVSPPETIRLDCSLAVRGSTATLRRETRAPLSRRA